MPESLERGKCGAAARAGGELGADCPPYTNDESYDSCGDELGARCSRRARVPRFSGGDVSSYSREARTDITFEPTQRWGRSSSRPGALNCSWVGFRARADIRSALGGPGGTRAHDSRTESPGSFRRISSSTGSAAASQYGRW